MKRGYLRKNKLPPGMSPKDIERMRILLAEALESVDSEKSQWILNHSFLVSEYHLETDSAKKSRLLQEIGHSEERGHKVGFSQPLIRALNRLILEEREKERLSELKEKLGKKILEEEKRRINKIKIGKR